jgi:beta-galactosidase beta subunit
MIIDTLNNSDKYTSLHPRFAKAFEFIKSQNLESIAVGKYPIDGPSFMHQFLKKKAIQGKLRSLNVTTTG